MLKLTEHLFAWAPSVETMDFYERALYNQILASQDPRTGMWCQVVGKPDAQGNWNETSGTGMFLYLIKKSMDRGYIDQAEYVPVVKKAYAGITKKARTGADGLIDIFDCSSIGIQNTVPPAN